MTPGVRYHQGTRRYHRIAVLTWLAVAGIVLFHLITLRDGVTWAGSGRDLALSIIHGMNILEGRSYFDTSAYVSVEMLNGATPHTYPVLYSLLQAVLYSTAGTTHYFVIAKLIDLVAFGVALFFFTKIVVARDGYDTALLAVVTFACAPYIFDFKEHIRSDLLFAALLYGLFWYRTELNNRAATSLRDRRTHLHAAALAILLFLMIAIRSISVVVLPALLLLDLVKRGRLTWMTIEAVIGAVVLYVIQGQIIGYVETGYASSDFPGDIASLISVVVRNTRQYIWNLREFLSFASPSLDPIAIAVFVVSVVLFVAGYIISMMRGIRLHDIFVLFYFALLLAHNTTSAWARYLIPVMPIFFYYVFVGLLFVGAKVVPRHRTAPAALYLLAVAAMYLSVYGSWTSFGPISSGPKEEHHFAIHKTIQSMTPFDAVIMSQMHHWTHLLTERKAAATPSLSPPNGELEPMMRQYVERAGIDYVLVRHADRERTGFYGVERFDQSDSDAIRRWILETTEFEEISREGPYRLYRKLVIHGR